jgi:hypothetical protein
MPRKYEKKSPYWNAISKTDGDESPKVETSFASFTGGESFASEVTPQRINRELGGSGNSSISKRFPFINDGVLPYVGGQENGSVNISDAIELTQKAWANIALVRNTIEAQVEFSNTKIKLRSKNKTAKKFFESWLEKIKIYDLAESFYRELYRSGNVFLYKLRGKINKNLEDELNSSYGFNMIGAEIPLKYLLLNPAYISATNGVLGKPSYSKILNSFELKQIFNNKSEINQKIIQDLDELTIQSLQESLKNSYSTNQKIVLPLKEDRLLCSFYQKQDYEPMAIPPIWGVLDDLELKLTFKCADKIISRTVEQIILLVTSGEEPDKGGINPNQMKALEDLFRNKNVQRVLVADYTTKLDFIIPDLNKVLGEGKYKVVDRDIREGLQSLTIGEQKFSNGVTQVKLFLQRLKSGRRKLKELLEGEMEVIAKNVGLKSIPQILFEEIDLKDEVQLQRAYNRLLELGAVTPPELLELYKDGMLPSEEESLEAQKKYLEYKDKGYYMPNSMIRKNDNTESDGRPAGSDGIEQENERESRVTASDCVSVKSIKDSLKSMNSFKESCLEMAKNKYGVESLSEIQQKTVESLYKNIILTSKQENWQNNLSEFLNAGSLKSDYSVITELEEIAEKFEVSEDDAALIFHSKNFKK